MILIQETTLMRTLLFTITYLLTLLKGVQGEREASKDQDFWSLFNEN